ncbi:MAG: signal transduction histidine kinase, partial [Cryomorphaceae bacterium]
MKSPESQEHGYVSGRVSSAFIDAAIICGVSESALRSISIRNSFESCCDKRNLCYWNDFIQLVDCAYTELGGFAGLRAIGNKMTSVMSDMAYIKWIGKIVSLKLASRIMGNNSYNFPNMIPSCKIHQDHVEMHVKMKYSGDCYSRNFIYLSEGIIESIPQMLGYAKASRVVFDIDLDDENLAPREMVYRMYFPPKRTTFKYIKHLMSTLSIRNHNQQLLGDHIAEVNHQESRNREKLDSLYSLIMNIKDAVLIIRGGTILTQNTAFNKLYEAEAQTMWHEYFVDPDLVVNFLKSELESPSNTCCQTFLKRPNQANLEVEIQIASIKQSDASVEAILRLHEANVPTDPNEIASLARETERKSLARDIHDSLGQLLTATSLQLATLELTEGDEIRSKKIAQISHMVREITLYSRKFTRQLDLLIDECNSIYDVVELVREEFSIVAGIQVRNKVKPNFHINHPESIRHIGYVLQEAMNNAYRHGKATQIVVSSHEAKEKKTLHIMDNGSGMQQVIAKAGLGLRSMEYRIKKIGGQMS